MLKQWQEQRVSCHQLNATNAIIIHERDNLQKLLRSQDDEISDMKDKVTISIHLFFLFYFRLPYVESNIASRVGSM